jgi:hypothetical protein
MLTDAERARLAAHGVNPLQALRAASPRALTLRTLAGGSAATAAGRQLTAQRRLLLLMARIERGTRWAMFETSGRGVWQKLERQVQGFLQPLAAAGLFGPADDPGAFHVVCDERVNTAADVEAGRINLLVSLGATAAGQQRSFMVTHSMTGSRVRPVRSNVLPAGTRMTVHEQDAASPLGETQPQRTLAQSLFGHYGEPRPAPSLAAIDRDTVAPAAGRLDAETIARIHAELGRRLQRF